MRDTPDLPLVPDDDAFTVSMRSVLTEADVLSWYDNVLKQQLADSKDATAALKSEHEASRSRAKASRIFSGGSG